MCSKDFGLVQRDVWIFNLWLLRGDLHHTWWKHVLFRIGAGHTPTGISWPENEVKPLGQSVDQSCLRNEAPVKKSGHWSLGELLLLAILHTTLSHTSNMLDCQYWCQNKLCIWSSPRHCSVWVLPWSLTCILSL